MPTIVKTDRIQPEHQTTEKKLLALLGEELKQPLVSIAQLAEMSDNQQIGEQARRALRTIDTVLLYERIVCGQLQLRLEPIHVGSIVTDIAYTMKPLMVAQDCCLRLDIQQALQPVEADRHVLRTALTSLLQGFLDIVPVSSEIICRVNRTRAGVRLSFVSENADLTSFSLTSHNSSVQPLSSLHGPATDLMTAKHMMELFGSQLTRTSTKLASGIGLTLKPSRQLQIM